MLKPYSVANLNISAITKQEFLNEVTSLLATSKQTFVTTPNSEFLYASLRDNNLRDLFNSADIALADGVAILWAERFLDWPFLTTGYFTKIIEACFQVVVTGARILLTPWYLYRNIPEKITGADVFYDLIAMAAKNSHSVYFINHRSDSAETTARLLRNKHPNLQIVGTSRKNFSDETLLADIREAKPDLLFVSYGQPQQEKWINQHLHNLPAKLAMGIGGTFDYVAGFKIAPPAWIRNIGLEWLFRLVTQPSRFKRIYRAVWGLILSLVRYKVFHSMPLRPNATAVTINGNGEVLIVKRNPNDPYLKDTGDTAAGKFANYWQFPRGGVDSGESFRQAAARELFEETGLRNVEYLSEPEGSLDYEWMNAKRRLLGNVYKFRGQEQHLVFFKFAGSDKEIKLDNRELVDFQWVNASQLTTIFHSELHGVAKLVQTHLGIEKTS